MYIDTHSYDMMMRSVCQYLRIRKDTLQKFFVQLRMKSAKENYVDGDIFNNEINIFCSDHLPLVSVDEIPFFHLGRRLNLAKDTLVGDNLYDLLMQKSELSDFLGRFDIRFSSSTNYIEMYYNNRLVALENRNDSNICYLRSRLGYNNGREDFCFNGFAFKDLLYKNSYARSLYHGPEFIDVLSRFLKRSDIQREYVSNSQYYCFEYCVPFEVVLFDNNDMLNQEEKHLYFLNCLLKRLYEYFTTNIKYMFDHDNPILRLKDKETMKAQYYVARESISADMLTW